MTTNGRTSAGWIHDLSDGGQPPETGDPRRHILYGAIAYLLAVLLLVGLSFVQLLLGLWGLVITELALAAFALLACLIRRIDLASAFPIMKPRKGEPIAALMLWIGTFLWVSVAATLQMLLFPQTAAVGEAVGEAITSSGVLFISLLVGALLPGICEEMLFRGFFYRAFSTLPKRKYAVPVVGILFGAFHLSLYRFLPTALLGILLTYLIYRTGNLLLPVAVHTLNNAFSVLVTSLSAGAAETAATAEAMAAGYTLTGELMLSMLFCAVLGTLLLYRGVRRLDRAAMGWPKRRVRPEDEIVM